MIADQRPPRSVFVWIERADIVLISFDNTDIVCYPFIEVKDIIRHPVTADNMRSILEKIASNCNRGIFSHGNINVKEGIITVKPGTIQIEWHNISS